MKKSTKLLIASAILVAILGAALTVILMLPSDNNNRITTDDNNDILLFDKSSLTPEKITVSNAGGDYELLAYNYDQFVSSSPSDDGEEEEPNIIYTMQNYPELTLDKSITDDIVRQCSSMAAKELIDKSGQRLDEFGLKQPLATVDIRFSDASTVKFHIGKDAPDNKGTYLQMDGNKNVYLVQTSTLDALLIEPLQLFDKTLTGSIDEVSELTISGTGYQDAISVVKNEYECYSSFYLMNKPSRIACDNSKTNEILNSIYNLKAQWVVTVKASKEDIKKYRLDKPFENFFIKGADGSEIHIIASEKDNNDRFYLMNPNSSVIYQGTEKENPWFGVEKKGFLADAVFKPDLESVSEIKAALPDEAIDYVITRKSDLNENYYEIVDVKLTRNQQEISYSLLSQFIEDLTELSRTDNAPSSFEKSKELLSLTFYYYSEENITDKLALYRDSDGKTIAVLNDSIECYVDSAKADNLIKNLP